MLGEVLTTEEIYAISDITINCSRLEGLALTSFESLAMNVPVVSSDVGGQTELIDNNVGRIVHYKEKMTKNESQQEILAYVRSIEEVLMNLESLKNNCRNKIINNKYTLDNMVKRFEDIFDNIKANKKEVINNTKLIYEMSLETLFKEHYYNTKNYIENKFNIDCENEDNNAITIKRKIKSKVYNVCSGYGIVEDIKTFINLLHQIYYLSFGLIKYILIHFIYFIKFIILSIPAGINIIIKYTKAKIK